MEINNIHIVQREFKFIPGSYHIVLVVCREKDFNPGEWPYGKDPRKVLLIRIVDSFEALQSLMESTIKPTCIQFNARCYISCGSYEVPSGYEFNLESTRLTGGIEFVRELKPIGETYCLYDLDKGWEYVGEQIRVWLIDKGYYKYTCPTVTGKSFICSSFTEVPDFLPSDLFNPNIHWNPDILLYHNKVCLCP